MKTRYTILSVAAAALALTACSNEDELSLQQGDEVVKIASASVVNSAQTRVNSDGAGDTFDSGDSFCLINKSRPSQNKGTYATTDGTNWTQSEGLVLWASGTNEFSAYMPATAAIEPFFIPEDQSTIEKLKAADYMTATASVEKGGDVNLQFAHQLTKVTLKISYTNQYKGDEVVSALKILKIPNSTPNNNVIMQAGDGFIPYPFVADKTLSEVAQQSYTAIVIPGSYNNSGSYMYFMTMTINGTEVKFEANDFLKSSSALQAGKAYTFNVQVGESQANVSQASVRAWSGTDPLDDVEPENPFTTVKLTPITGNENGRYFTAHNTNDEVFTTALTADYVKVTGTMPSVLYSDGWNDLFELLGSSQKLKTLDLSATTATTMSRTSLFQSQSVETIIMPATLTSITENNFSQCPNLQVVDLSLCTNVPNVDSNAAFIDNGENYEEREVTVYVAPGKKIEFSNYRPEGGSSYYPWATLENENRIKIVEKE